MTRADGNQQSDGAAQSESEKKKISKIVWPGILLNGQRERQVRKSAASLDQNNVQLKPTKEAK
jgi:hypothetical protein